MRIRYKVGIAASDAALRTGGEGSDAAAGGVAADGAAGSFGSIGKSAMLSNSASDRASGILNSPSIALLASAFLALELGGSCGNFGASTCSEVEGELASSHGCAVGVGCSWAVGWVAGEPSSSGSSGDGAAVAGSSVIPCQANVAGGSLVWCIPPSEPGPKPGETMRVPYAYIRSQICASTAIPTHFASGLVCPHRVQEATSRLIAMTAKTTPRTMAHARLAVGAPIAAIHPPPAIHSTMSPVMSMIVTGSERWACAKRSSSKQHFLLPRD
ncbi:MAG: hypothetical protein ACK57G_07595 [Planctomycetota bacterium]